MGAHLIERDRQNVSVTSLGEEVVARAIKLLAGAEGLVEYTLNTGDSMTGTIKLGVIPTIAPFVLPQVLPQIRQQYADLKITLREDLTANLLKRVLDHQLDFALIALPYDTEGLLVKELYGDEFWLTAHADEPALKAPEVKVAASMTDRLLLLEEGHCLREHSLRACRQKETPSPDGVEATSLLPEMAIKGGILNNTSLMARPLSAPAPKRGIALVARQTTARIDEFLAIANIIAEQHHQSRKSTVSRKKAFKTK